MDSIRSLIKDSSIYGLTELLNRGMQVLLLPLIFIYLDQSEFGILDYFLTIKNIVAVIMGIGLGTVIQRYKMWESRYSLQQLVSTAFFTILCIDALYLIVAYLIKDSFSYLLVGEDFSLAWVLVNVISVFFALRTIPLGVLRLKQKPTQFLIVSLSNFIFYFIFTLLLLQMGYRGYLSFLVGATAAIAISLMIGMIFTRNSFKWNIDFGLTKDLLAFGVSVLASSSTIMILSSINRFFLKWNGSFEDLAILGLATRLSIVIGAFLVAPFNLAWLPYASKNYHEKTFRETYTSIVKGFLLAGMLMVISLTLFIKEFLMVIGQESYIDAVGIIPFFALTYIFQGLYFLSTSSIFLEGYKARYYTISVLTMAINVSMYLLSYRYIGLFSVSVITLLGFISMFLIGNTLASEKTKISLNSTFILSVISVGLIVSVLNYYTYRILDGPYLFPIKAILFAVIVIFAYNFFRNTIGKISLK